ncbi:MAG: DUF1684 domain-containing protein [Actinomycetota bacterium]
MPEPSPAARAVDDGAAGLLALTDWRRRIAELYRRARDAPASEPAWVAWREARDELFRTHDASPIPPDRRGAYVQTPFFVYDPAARVRATVVEAVQEPLEIMGSHGSFRATRFAVAGFEIHGSPCSLDLFWLDGYAGGLFLPFRDATCDASSYGAGRYLLDTVKGADLGMEDRQLVLDFNFAFNPSCAYDPRWACPLAPPGNRLDVAIEAGERRPV